MTQNKKITINIIMQLISFGVTIFISLFVTPLIVDKLGGEAYGFVGLANSFVSYASIITIALNSMASRFVSIEIYRNDFKEANKYFTSVFFANALVAIALTPILIILVWKLQLFIQIPTNLVIDVKLTFAVMFLQFLLSLLLSRYEIATFVTNKLYLTQKNTLISSLIRLLIVLISFIIFSPKIVFVVLGILFGNLFVHIMNMYYTKKFLPELRVNSKLFSFKHIKTLLASGVWNLINKLGALLLDGFDLLISNLFIGPVEMGALALSKTIPAMFLSLRGTLDYPFAPPMTECYAKGDIEGVVKNARMGNKLLGVFMIAPMATFAVLGQNFFKLWVPSENSFMIQVLSLLSIASLIAGSCINSIFTIFSITNKLKLQSLIILGTGVLTLITNFVLLKTTTLGVYVIAGVSSFYSLIRNFIFTPLYGAHCLGVKKSTFYHEIFTGIICLIINLIVGLFVTKFITANSWIMLILAAAIIVVISIIINFFIVFNKEEKNFVFGFLKKFLNKFKTST